MYRCCVIDPSKSQNCQKPSKFDQKIKKLKFQTADVKF